jgi:hypothetical protein
MDRYPAGLLSALERWAIFPKGFEKFYRKADKGKFDKKKGNSGGNSPKDSNPEPANKGFQIAGLVLAAGAIYVMTSGPHG